MANHSSIPMYWDLNNSTTIHYNDTKLAISAAGEMALEGNCRDAAMGIFKYIVDKEYSRSIDILQVSINYTLCVKFDETTHLKYIGSEPPVFWDELVTEFDRIVRMKAFW